jgi:hypothetical protein
MAGVDLPAVNYRGSPAALSDLIAGHVRPDCIIGRLYQGRFVALVEASEPKPGKRGPYEKRVAPSLSCFVLVFVLGLNLLLLLGGGLRLRTRGRWN